MGVVSSKPQRSSPSKPFSELSNTRQSPPSNSSTVDVADGQGSTNRDEMFDEAASTSGTVRDATPIPRRGPTGTNVADRNATHINRRGPAPSGSPANGRGTSPLAALMGGQSSPSLLRRAAFNSSPDGRRAVPNASPSGKRRLSNFFDNAVSNAMAAGNVPSPVRAGGVRMTPLSGSKSSHIQARSFCRLRSPSTPAATSGIFDGNVDMEALGPVGSGMVLSSRSSRSPRAMATPVSMRAAARTRSSSTGALSPVEGASSAALGTTPLHQGRTCTSLATGEAQEETRVVSYDDFITLQKIGEGEFANVFAETLDGEPVALKILKPTKSDDVAAVKGLKQEIMLMSLMDHPNVLKAIALGEESGKPFMVVQRLDTVLSALLPTDETTTPFWVHREQVRQWPLSRALHCGLELARALAFCHDSAFLGFRVLHRDVKPANIGFVRNRLVLFDFGLATLWRLRGDADNDDKPRALTGQTGSLRYMAPEVTKMDTLYSHKAEVFSFATVLWEMAAHRRPFHDCSPDLLAEQLDRGHRPTIKKRWPDDLKLILGECWRADPSARPEMCQLVPRLQVLLEAALDDEAMKPSSWRQKFSQIDNGPAAGIASPRATQRCVIS